jgi:hypothetical protein
LPLLALYSRLCDATAVGVGVGEPELSREAVGAAEALGGAFVGEMLGVVDRLPLRDTPGLLETLGLAEKEGV